LPQAPPPVAEDHALDFDLGGLDFEPVNAPAAPVEVTYATPATEAAFEATAVPDLDFFHNDTAPVAAAAAVAQAPAPAPAAEPEADPFDIDFDMDFDAPAAAAAAPVAATAKAPALDDAFDDFDLASLPGEPTAAPVATAPAPIELAKPAPALDTSFMLDDLPTLAPAERTAAAPSFDMSGIDLELPQATSATAPAPHAADDFGIDFPFDEPATAGDFAADTSGNSVMSSALMEMETKLDLALAYQEIGDKEGARELLDEVIKGGNSEQVSKANAMRAQLA